MALPSSAGGFQFGFLFALRRKARWVVLAQLCKSCSFFFACYFSPLGACQVFSRVALAKQAGSGGSCSPCTCELAGSQRPALWHRRGGSCCHRECHTATREETAHMDQAFWCDPHSFPAGCEPLELQTPSSHRARETHVRSAAGQERAHANIANE